MHFFTLVHFLVLRWFEQTHTNTHTHTHTNIYIYIYIYTHKNSFHTTPTVSICFRCIIIINIVVCLVFCLFLFVRINPLLISFIPVVFIIKLDWSICICLTQLYDGRDMYRIYYIKNNYMFRHWRWPIKVPKHVVILYVINSIHISTII